MTHSSTMLPRVSGASLTVTALTMWSPASVMRSAGAIAIFAWLVMGDPRASAQDGSGRPALTIDIPSKLSAAKVVFNVSRPAFEGDEPTGLSFLRVMAAQFREQRIEGRIVAVFHGGSGYMLLGDAAYGRVRRRTDGNPYKHQIADLQEAGVAFEECGKTMSDHGWTNGDMLPGVKINSGANFRIVELVQEGFVQIQP